jgi:hypothetical protein
MRNLNKLIYYNGSSNVLKPRGDEISTADNEQLPKHKTHEIIEKTRSISIKPDMDSQLMKQENSSRTNSVSVTRVRSLCNNRKSRKHHETATFPMDRIEDVNKKTVVASLPHQTEKNQSRSSRPRNINVRVMN